MAREIKFRAWDTANNEMVYNVHLNDGKPVKPSYQWFSPQNTVHDSELMQYTGLRDKNGTEIYEGDVVTDGRYSYEIRWSDQTPAFEAALVGSSLFNWLSDDMSECEVIGNIYENADLLANTVSE